MTVLMSDQLISDFEKASDISYQLVGQRLITPFQSLQERMLYLAMYANYDLPDNTFCVLSSDFAPLSFSFCMYIKAKPGMGMKPSNWLVREFPELEGYAFWFNGGLIFHGKHDNGGDGSAPTFSVNLSPTNGWSIHT